MQSGRKFAILVPGQCNIPKTTDDSMVRALPSLFTCAEYTFDEGH